MMKKTLLAISGGLFAVALSASVAHADEGLIFHIPFDEGYGTSAHALVGTSTGVFQGGIGWASGKIGNAVGFKGESGQSIGLGSSVLPQGTQGTIAFWIKSDARSDHSVIFALRDPNDNTKYFALALDLDGRPVVKYRSGTGALERMTQGAKALDINTWYQVIVEANSQRYFMYLNGEVLDVSGDNSGKWITDVFTGPMNYTVGSLDASPLAGSFSGMIDDVRVYDHVLTASEVTALYTTTNESRPTTPLVALPQIVLTISDKTVPYNGSVKVSWSVTNADTCTASWGKSIGLSGEAVFTNLIDSTGYSVTCTKTGGAKIAQEVNVTVQPKAVVSPAVPNNTMTAAARDALIVEIKAKIAELIKLYNAALAEEQKAKTY